MKMKQNRFGLLIVMGLLAPGAFGAGPVNVPRPWVSPLT